MLSSLINFSIRQNKVALKNMDSNPVKIMDFYKSMFLHFYWYKTLTRIVEEGSHTERVVKGKKDLELAGVVCPVHSEQLEAGAGGRERAYRAASYQRRANNSHGFHNDHVSMDKCLDKPVQVEAGCNAM